MKVHKHVFENSLLGLHSLQLPMKSIVRSAQVQAGKVVMWYTIPEEVVGTVERRFRFYTTGFDSIPLTAAYISTIQFRDYVLHLFEVE